MFDKILYINSRCVVIFFTHRTPVTVSSSDGNAMDMADELLSPNFNFVTLSDYQRAVASSEEDTQIINLEEVA